MLPKIVLICTNLLFSKMQFYDVLQQGNILILELISAAYQQILF